MPDPKLSSDPLVRRRLLLRMLAAGGFVAASGQALAAPLGSSLLRSEGGTDADSDTADDPCTHSNSKSHSYMYPVETWTTTDLWYDGTRTGTWTESYARPKTYSESSTGTHSQTWGTATLTAVARTYVLTVSQNAEFTELYTLSRAAPNAPATGTRSLITTATGGISYTYIERTTYTSTVPCDDDDEAPKELLVRVDPSAAVGNRSLGRIDASRDVFDPERRRGSATRLNI